MTARFDPLVLINGDPEIGENTRIGIFSEVYDKGGIVKIGRGCDIASFVAINCADSHLACLAGGTDPAFGGAGVERLPIEIGDCVFIGSHSFIAGGCRIGHHSVIGAGTILPKHTIVKPYSLVTGQARAISIHDGYFER